MAQNTQTVTLGNLTIKYSPKYPPGTDALMKLGRSVRLARRALEVSIEALRPLEAARVLSSQALPESLFLVLRYHFRFNPDTATTGPRGAWQLNAARIANNMRQILLGLMGNVAIADAYATTMGKAVDGEVARFRRRLGDRAATEEEADQLLERMVKAGQGAHTASADVRGFVSLKKPFALQLDAEGKLDDYARDKMRWDEPSKQFLPEVDAGPLDRGSIHINFDALLRADRQVSDLRVARTIIHEASHKFCNTQDHAYADRPVYRELMMEQSMWNADSYAFAAVSLYKGICFLDDEQMARAPVENGVDANA